MSAPGATSTTYSGRVTNWPMIWLTVVLAIPLLAMSDASWSPMFVALGIVATAWVATVLTASSVRVTAGSNGVLVRFGVFGWPRFGYPLQRIQSAEEIDIPFWSMLGWGIYWSPRRGLLLTLRTGPALRLRLTNGRKVTISVPDPAAAVAALHAARSRMTP